MDFFNRHTSVNESFGSSKVFATKKPQLHIPRHPLSNATKDAHPLAMSTPLSLPKTVINDVQQKGLSTDLFRQSERTKMKNSITVNNEKIADESPSNHTISTSATEENPENTENSSHCTNTATTQQADSADSRMEMLYESLQTEAQKIQKFKVHAMAQLKQKADEVALKESQIKNLSSELTTAKTMNSSLVAQLQKQKRSNDDMMKKVATTREMCFALAEEHLAFKNLMGVGKSLLQEIKKKSFVHTNSVQDASSQIDKYKASTEQQFLMVKQAVESKQQAINLLIDKHKWREQSLNEEITAGNTKCQDLQGTLDKCLKELTCVKEELLSSQKMNEEREATMVTAMEELTLSKNTELSCLHEKLDATISNNEKLREDNLQEMADVKQELALCFANLQATAADLQAEMLKNQQLSDEKAKCNEKLTENDDHIASLTQAKNELEQQLTACKEGLENANTLLAQGKAAFSDLQSSSAELKANLERELGEKDDDIAAFKTGEEQLKALLADLNSANQQLEVKCEAMESANIGVTDKLKAAENEVAATTEKLDCLSSELDECRQKLNNALREADTDQVAMNELMGKLKVDHEKEVEAKVATISSLNQRLVDRDAKIEQLAADHDKFVATSETELTSVKELMSMEKQEHECLIKEKTAAFVKAQGEMQRLLEETTANGKKQVEYVEAQMKTQQSEYEASLKEETNYFTKVQDELQSMIDNAERKIEQDAVKMEDLNQELVITKNSLDKSLEEKNDMAASLAQMTQELQVTSNKLLAKECEFSKLTSAIHNLKSRWTAVTTPMTPVATPPSIQQAAVKPTSYGTPLKQTSSNIPSTPTLGNTLSAHPNSVTPKKRSQLNGSVTPIFNGSFNTPHTPNSSVSSDNPKGILRNVGSASKSNRVVFSTPIEQKNAVAPSESDTSVLDLEVVNKSLQLKSPQNSSMNLSRTSNASVKNKNSPLMSEKVAVGPLNKVATPNNQNHLNSSLSPALSSQNSSDRLPRSRMLKASHSKKRLRPDGKREHPGMLTKTMKKHRALMGNSMSIVKPVRESDSDCFGFGSE